MTTTNSQISRRTVAKGMAWAVPAVTVAGTVPAFAVSPQSAIGGYVAAIRYAGGWTAHQDTTVTLAATSSTGTIPAGTVLTYHVYSTPGVPLVSPHTSVTVSGSSPSIVTVTLPEDVDSGDTVATLTWARVPSSMHVLPGSEVRVAFISASDDTGPVSSQPSELVFNVAKRGTQDGTTSAHVFVSRSGAQTCYPSVQYSYSGVSPSTECLPVGGFNTSTMYPDGTCRMVVLPGDVTTVPTVC